MAPLYSELVVLQPSLRWKSCRPTRDRRLRITTTASPMWTRGGPPRPSACPSPRGGSSPTFPDRQSGRPPPPPPPPKPLCLRGGSSLPHASRTFQPRDPSSRPGSPQWSPANPTCRHRRHHQWPRWPRWTTASRRRSPNRGGTFTVS